MKALKNKWLSQNKIIIATIIGMMLTVIGLSMLLVPPQTNQIQTKTDIWIIGIIFIVGFTIMHQAMRINGERKGKYLLNDIISILASIMLTSGLVIYKSPIPMIRNQNMVSIFMMILGLLITIYLWRTNELKKNPDERWKY